MSDETIQCVDCGRTFIWSYGEQRYYRENHLEPPKRCPDCRSHRRSERATSSAMASARGHSTTRPRVTLPSPSQRTSSSPKDSSWQSWWPNPYWFYGLIAIILLLIVTIFAFVVIQDWGLSYLFGINLIAWLLYGFDKLVAQIKWLRVPERILIMPVLAFGFVGAELGRRIFHHKTSDREFRVKYWIAVVVEILLIVAYLVFILRGK